VGARRLAPSHSVPGGNDKLIWPQCAGLIWRQGENPHGPDAYLFHHSRQNEHPSHP
jgi:hypothetical protein